MTKEQHAAQVRNLRAALETVTEAYNTSTRDDDIDELWACKMETTSHLRALEAREV
jgi:hypothetical protein